ncbi:MAG: dihydrofolate reductase [Gammaproteobacteria bacterium]|nr:dihydrofolate reductase [Gammaproteobacteria bacterium]
MILSIVVAMDQNGLIGANNRLPWHIPADLRHFKALTMGHPILMGRRTHESIGRPLPGRQNIVLTNRRDYAADGCTVVHEIEAALKAADADAELMVVGGATVFAQLLPRVETIHMTRVHHAFEGDTFFPAISPEDWRETVRRDFAVDENNRFAYSFVRLERRPRLSGGCKTPGRAVG